MTTELKLMVPTWSHVRYVADNVRAEEFLEAEMLGNSVFSLLATTIQRADECFAMVDAEGNAVAIIGVGTNEFGFGTPWMVATPEVYEHRRLMMRLPRPYLARWLARYTKLTNYCLTNNTRSIRWLEALGFVTLDRPDGWTQFTLE